MAQVTCSMLHCAPCSTLAMQASLFFVACALAGCLRSASWDVADAGGGYGRVQVRCVGGRLDVDAVLCAVRSCVVSPVAWTSLASTCHAILPRVVLFVALASDAALSALVRLLGFIMLSSAWSSSSWSPSSCSCFALCQWGRCLSRRWSLWV